MIDSATAAQYNRRITKLEDTVVGLKLAIYALFTLALVALLVAVNA
jgi:hypothetical protein